MTTFTTIGVLGRGGSIPVVESLKKLCGFLASRGNAVVIEVQTAALLPGCPYPTAPLENIGREVDLMIVVGGDGSMLRAARALCSQDVPVLGINRGNLGFLTDIHPDEIEARVEQVLQGHYHLERRFLLDMLIMRQGSVHVRAEAMNEVVLHRGSSLRMIEFELFIDGRFVYSQHSDGVIACTPTGSTAYSLSGGGPILHPSLDAIAVVPMFAHSLTSRPLVVGGNSEIRMVVGHYSGGHPEVSCDGFHNFPVQSDDVLYIQKKPQHLTLIHPESHDFFDTCRSKLGWGSRLA